MSKPSKRRTTPALLVIALLSSGCASTFGGAGSQAEDGTDEVLELQRRVLELQRSAARAEVEIERLRRLVAELDERLSASAAAAVAPAPSVPVSPIPADRPERPAPAPVAETEPPVEPAVAEIEESDLSADRVEMDAAASTDPGVPASVAALGPAPVSPEAQEVYDRGYTQYHQGRYLDAEASFQQFLQGPVNELTDNAQFWVGESRFARGDVAGALAAYRETVERYPDGNKHADALLKIGDCHRALGDEAAARERFEEVLRRFPGSAASAMAEERLGSL